MIYITIFVVSIFFAYLSEKTIDRYRYVGIICLLLSILPPALLAGMRDDSIGTDVTVYVTPLVRAASNANDFGSYIGSVSDGTIEILFCILVYFTTYSDDAGSVLLVIELLELVPLYIALFRYRKNIKVWVGLTFFYLIFYNMGLNIMRQMISASLLLCAYSFLRSKKWFIISALTICSVLFHRTSIIFAFIFYGIFYLYEVKKYNIMYVFILLSLIGGISIYVVLNIIDISDLTREYALRTAVRENENNFGVKRLLLYGYVLVLPFIASRKNRGISLICFLGFLINFMTLYSSYFIRLTIPPVLFSCVSFPLFVSIKKRNQQFILLSILISICVLMYILGVIIGGGDETYPYKLR